MRIIYVANATAVDSPLGYCPNYKWIAAALNTFGHDVDVLNEADLEPEDVIKELPGHDMLLFEEGRLKGDFVNDEKGNDIVLGKFKAVMDAFPGPKVSWLTNVFFGIMRREVQVATNPIFKADIVFSTDGGHQAEFEAAGVNHVLLRQGIAEDEAYLAKPDFPAASPIAFVGAVYEEIWPYRKELIEFLKSTYKGKFMHVGQRGEVRHEELNALCATVKVVVGDSVYSPRYWSNRIYEIIGRGGFLIHPMVDGLDEDFTPYEHFVPYNYGDWEGLKEKIDYYLMHEEERDKIRRAGLAHCKEHHTYRHRAKKLLETMVAQGLITHGQAFPV